MSCAAIGGKDVLNRGNNAQTLRQKHAHHVPGAETRMAEAELTGKKQ